MADEDRPLSDAFDITLLDPARIRFFHAPSGDSRLRLELDCERSYIDVLVARALPLSNPNQFLAIRDAADKDIGIVRDWAQLDAASFKVVSETLNRSYFLPKVSKVYNVTDQFGVVIWDVETDYGKRRYTVRNIRDNSVALSSKRVIMTDVEGERFEFPNIENYSSAALEVLLKVL